MVANFLSNSTAGGVDPLKSCFTKLSLLYIAGNIFCAGYQAALSMFYSFPGTAIILFRKGFSLMAQSGGADLLYALLRHPFHTVQAHSEPSLSCRILLKVLHVPRPCTCFSLTAQTDGICIAQALHFVNQLVADH